MKTIVVLFNLLFVVLLLVLLAVYMSFGESSGRLDVGTALAAGASDAPLHLLYYAIGGFCLAMLINVLYFKQAAQRL